MSADDAVRLRALAERLGAAEMREADLGELRVIRFLDLPRIERADKVIRVSVELVEQADPQWLAFAEERDDDGQSVGVLTFVAPNRVVQYRVLGSDDRWGLAGVTCERIDEAVSTNRPAEI